MDFAEFLEMVGRVAHLLYKEEIERSFEEKLEAVI